MDIPPAVDRDTDPERSRVGEGTGRPALLVAIGIVAVITVAVLKPWGLLSVRPVAVTIAPTPPRPAQRAAFESSSTTAARSAPGVPLRPGGLVPIGPLDPGTYTYGDVDGRGFNIRFTVPAGWAWDGTSLSAGERGEDAVITFFTGDVQVYHDPCHWLGNPIPGPTGPDVRSLMAPLTAQRGNQASTPVDRAAPALPPQQPWPGRAIELIVPSGLGSSTCDAGHQVLFRAWVPERDRFFEHERVALASPGQSDYVWAVQIGPDRLILDAITVPGTPAQVRSDVEAILRSIVIAA